ncbi:MAG: hypothetical protein KGQ41_03630 [Alphaproteobacteria bacterium]|nr:hypothetical protein [Alphaproteobacteria bacterium]
MNKSFLRTCLAFAVVAVLAATPAVAQQEPAVMQPPAAPAPTAGTTGSELPFINSGANQPVLQTISPDGQAIAPDEMEAPVGEAAEGAAHGEGGHSKGLPQFDVSTFPKQLFWLALTFAFLYVTFSTVTLPRIGNVIDKRAAKVSADLEAAQSLKSEVERLRGEYEAAIAAAQSEAAKLITTVQSDIKRMAEQQDAAYKARTEEAVEQLEKKIDVARKRIMADLNNLAADLTVDIAARVAGVKADSKTASAAVDGLSGKAKAA